MFLVEFAKPLVSRGKHPVHVQKTAKDDILEYVNGMKHSLLPGDRVLAPWEPDRARYGPGTVLRGIETRDPLRGKKRGCCLAPLECQMLYQDAAAREITEHRLQLSVAPSLQELMDICV